MAKAIWSAIALVYCLLALAEEAIAASKQDTILLLLACGLLWSGAMLFYVTMKDE